MSEIMQAIINHKKIKYAVLMPLVEKHFPGDTKSVDVFLNLDDVIRPFYNPKTNEIMNSLKPPEKHLLSSELINIVAHYRHFFWSRYGVPSNYFVYYSTERASFQTSTVPGWRRSHYEKRENNLEYAALNAMVRKNLKLSSLLSQYLPNIYFVNTGDVEPSVLAHYLMKHNEEPGLTRVILSNNPLDLQLVCHHDRAFVITLRSDDSEIVRREDVMGRLLSGSKRKKDTFLVPQFFVPALAISGVRKLGVEGVRGYGKVKSVSTIEKAVESGAISNVEYRTMSPIAEAIFGKGTPECETVSANFRAISYEHALSRITPKQADRIRRQLTNKSDNQSLIEINDRYYEKYPLMLIELMEGEY